MDDQRTPKDAVTKIDAVVAGYLDSLEAKEVKLSVVDVLRLLDLRKQLAGNEIREVRVTWVESNPDPFATNT